MRFEHLEVVAHADWSKNSAKRRMAVATALPDGAWLAHPTEEISHPHALLGDLKARASSKGSVLAGFDFPIGLPLKYAEKTGLEYFLPALDRFGSSDWFDFYCVATKIEEIHLKRPFYPNTPGGRKREHLNSRLGICFEDLYRQCEHAHPGRRAACPLFWTLGGQQVGKAAICGWKDVLAPGLRSGMLKFWPFSGELAELLLPGRIVAVETYPAEFYAPLGVKSSRMRFSKRNPSHRQECSSVLLGITKQFQIALQPALEEEIENGFGRHPDGEDRFDALVGLLGMLQTLSGWDHRREYLPDVVRQIEGWIFGQGLSSPSPARESGA